MFTGIVEELGTVASRDGARLRIEATTVLDDVEIGASIAVNGTCLTVVAWGDDWWEADVVDETFARTALGDLAPGDPVNLERPVRVGDRLGGHLVQGHVDAVGTIVDPAPDLRIAIPADLLRYVVEKGSITVDGTSLTVAAVHADGFSVAVIPHTAEVTTLGTRAPATRSTSSSTSWPSTSSPSWKDTAHERQPRSMPTPCRLRGADRGRPTTGRSPPSSEALAAFARGEILVVVDDEDRENEGDLIMAAEHVTPEKIAFFLHHTSGFICAPDHQRAGRRARPAARWSSTTPRACAPRSS